MLRLYLTEIKDRRNTIIIWILVWTGILALTLSLFDPLKDSFDDSFFENLPSFVQAFADYDTGYFDSVRNFISSEFVSFYVVISAIFAVIIGSGELSGKIEDTTIFYKLSNNISRLEFYLTQFLSNLSVIILTNVTLSAISYVLTILMTTDQNTPFSFYGRMFLAMSVIQIFFTLLAQLLGIVTNKSQSNIIGIVIAIFAWLINNLSRIPGFPDYLELVSPFYHLKLDKITDDNVLEITHLSIIIFLSAILFILGIIAFRNKNIHI
jgi:putative exporter of polyketide antibiotics